MLLTMRSQRLWLGYTILCDILFFKYVLHFSTSADIRASTAACFLSPSVGDFIKCLAKAKCKLTVSYKPRSTSVLFETSE